MKKTTLHFYALCLTMMLAAVAVQAQDIHFSQFYQSPLNLNPALTGVMNCNHRIVANYRNQWASVLKSNASASEVFPAPLCPTNATFLVFSVISVI